MRYSALECYTGSYNAVNALVNADNEFYIFQKITLINDGYQLIIQEYYTNVGL